MTLRHLLVTGFFAVGLFVVGGASADNSSPSAKNAKHCENVTEAQRAECNACVAQDKHHYHPGNAVGNRCHADAAPAPKKADK